MKRIGIIGGSGLYDIEGLEKLDSITLDTPFGTPSDSYELGELSGREVVFLPRHGRGHRLLPSEVNYCANIWGMKKLGVEHLISVSAVGSLKQELKPVDIVMVDQFGDGIVAHVSFGDPVCGNLHQVLVTAAQNCGLGDILHTAGTYINMEGPAFSTRAESNLYRSWGMDVIGMTNIAEARLAREAEICFATMAMVTDYDCWKTGEDESNVSVELVMQYVEKNVRNAKLILKEAVHHVGTERDCDCKDALKNAVMTDPDVMPEQTKDKLDLFLNK